MPAGPARPYGYIDRQLGLNRTSLRHACSTRAPPTGRGELSDRPDYRLLDRHGRRRRRGDAEAEDAEPRRDQRLRRRRCRRQSTGESLLVHLKKVLITFLSDDPLTRRIRPETPGCETGDSNYYKPLCTKSRIIINFNSSFLDLFSQLHFVTWHNHIFTHSFPSTHSLQFNPRS